MVENQNEEMDEEIRSAEEQESVVSSSESDDSSGLTLSPTGVWCTVGSGILLGGQLRARLNISGRTGAVVCMADRKS